MEPRSSEKVMGWRNPLWTENFLARAEQRVQELLVNPDCNPKPLMRDARQLMAALAQKRTAKAFIPALKDPAIAERIAQIVSRYLHGMEQRRIFIMRHRAAVGKRKRGIRRTH